MTSFLNNFLSPSFFSLMNSPLLPNTQAVRVNSGQSSFMRAFFLSAFLSLCSAEAHIIIGTSLFGVLAVSQEPLQLFIIVLVKLKKVTGSVALLKSQSGKKNEKLERFSVTLVLTGIMCYSRPPCLLSSISNSSPVFKMSSF